MGMLSIHGDAIWTQECTYDVLQDRSHCVQRLYTNIFGGIHGRLDGVWVSKGSSYKYVTDVGVVLITLDCAKFK